MIEKIGRNDSCPCGSGRKFKKCCNDKVIAMDTFVEQKLNELQLHFMRWAMREHKSEIGAHLAPYYETMNIPGDAKQTLNFFASLWYMTSVKRNGQTLLQDYLEEYVPQINNARVRDIVRTWNDATPSVFIVKNWIQDGHVIVEDVFTKEVRWVKLLEEQKQRREHGLGIGTVLPTESGYIFFTTFFYVPATVEETTKAAEELCKALDRTGANNARDFMSVSFMEVLQFFMFGTTIEQNNSADVANEVEQDVDQAEEVQEQTNTELTPGQTDVLEAYKAYARGRESEAELVDLGTRLWATYCEKAKPSLRKPQVAAAALYYLVDELVLGGKMTQVQLAKDFTVSSTSISSRYKDLRAVLEADLENDLVQEVAVAAQ